MAQKPKKWADSRAELVRTVAAVCAATGTLYLVADKVGLI